MKKVKIFSVIIILAMFLTLLTGCNTSTNTTNTTTVNKTNTANSAKATTTNKTNSTTNKTVDVKTYDFLTAASKQVAAPKSGETIAIFHIKDYGDIKVKFFNNIAPKAVENFTTHAKNGYYNGTTFHRVINDFMIQGGDPTATGRGGQSIWGKAFVDEFDYSVAPYRGALCMANSGTNTNGSQFFIEQAQYNETTAQQLKNAGYPDNLLEAYKKYGGSMHLFYVHTVFGQVIEGMDVVDKIAATSTDSNNKPLEDVVIESIEITTMQ
jgi:cyclophilin family peptidyl-prolyl cis-trans isomerase